MKDDFSIPAPVYSSDLKQALQDRRKALEAIAALGKESDDYGFDYGKTTRD